MKKILSIVLCAVVTSAFAAGDPIISDSLGTVGVTEITTSLSNAIVAVSYDDLADNEGGMVYSNLVKTANLTEGDKLVEFRDDKYTGWVLAKDGQTGVLYWQETNQAFLDASGKQINLFGSAAATARGAVGTGIWLVRQNPTVGNVAKPFYIYGKPVSNPTLELVTNKWNLVGNPMQGAAQVAFDGTVTEGDQIVIPIEPAGALCRYTYHIGKSEQTTGWRKVNSADQWEYGLPNIQSGLGFWIQTKEVVSLSWNVVNEN